MRNRCWRRWRSDLKLEKVMRHPNQFNLGFWKRFYKNGRYTLRYDKRNSVDEVIQVEVQCESHFEDYMYNNSRRKRDNPKRCSCWFCCNPRRANAGSWREKSLAELRFIENMEDDYD